MGLCVQGVFQISPSTCSTANQDGGVAIQMTQALGGEVTWKSEFYFLASLVGSPRYLVSVDSPHNLFANRELLAVFRMMEQAVNLRGHADPLIDKIHKGELELTAEYQRSKVDLKTLWPDLSDPTIKGAPDKFHGLLEHYAALRFIQQTFSSRLTDMSNGVYGPEEAVSHIQKDVVSVHMSEQYESSTMQSMIENMWFDRLKNPPATIKTGFKKMDNVIGALIPGCTYLWTARTSHGKSSWVSQVVDNQAEAGHRVGIISLEDSRSVWASRWMSKVSGVTLGKIRDNVLTAPDVATLTEEDQVALEKSVYKEHLKNVVLVDGPTGMPNHLHRLPPSYLRRRKEHALEERLARVLLGYDGEGSRQVADTPDVNSPA